MAAIAEGLSGHGGCLTGWDDGKLIHGWVWICCRDPLMMMLTAVTEALVMLSDGNAREVAWAWLALLASLCVVVVVLVVGLRG